MELIIEKPTDDQFFSTIDFNFEELKDELSISLLKYKGLQYTEENIKEAKEDRAKLNKFKDALDTRRKEIKAKCLEPYNEFETKIKQLIALVDEPMIEIDSQVKNYENKTKEEKRMEIEDYFYGNINELVKLVHFDKIFNPRWLNVSYSMANIKKEIDEIITKISNEFKIIDNEKSEFDQQMKDIYLQSFDLGAAMQEKTRLEKQKQLLEEHKAVQQAEEPKQEKPTVPQQNPVIKEQEDFEELDFRVWVTKQQKDALKQFLLTNNIKYGKVN